VAYSGPCNPDYLIQLYGLQSDPLPFSGVESNTESDPSMSPRSSKRRRLSTDSASKPPSSASFFSSFTSSNSGDGYTSALSSMSPHHSRKGSMDFPFPMYNSNPIRDQPCACAVLATPSGIFPCSLNPNPILSRSGILPSLHLPRSTTHPERTTRLPAMIPRRAQS
jgi:hypothetical protein